jgi:SAM-dependent methyltransferase
MDIAGWEQMYRSGERGAENHPTRLLVDILPELTPGNAVDLACGTGRNALFLAESGWNVTAVDGSRAAIAELQERAGKRGLPIRTQVQDLTSAEFDLPRDTFDLVVIAYYWQRDLFRKVTPALRGDGTVLAIAHVPEPGEALTYKRAAPGELQTFFGGWEILHYYEGPSRDPAHRRPVAEIVARRP